MLNLVLSSLVSSIILFGFGIKASKLLFNGNSNEFYENAIYGPIALSILTLFINFFFPLNKFIGSMIAIYAFFVFLKFFSNEKKKIKIIKFLVITSIISILLIYLSNINRPDAGLYHLPYISLINENKIIIGSSNIHFRFGHISNLQYISAAFNNYLFPIEFITMPMATIASFFFYFLTQKFLKSFKKDNSFFNLLFFLTLVFSIYSFNRYSNYGNDAISHMYFFIFIIIFLKINLNKISLNHFHEISILSIFLFTLKPFMIITFILPLIIMFFYKNYFQLLLNKKTVLACFFLGLWLLKNIFISGCIIYPLSTTCFDALTHFDAENTKKIAFESEAWAKDFPNINHDSKENNFSKSEEYIENFNWVATWYKNHFQIVIEKMIPYVIFLIVIFIFLIFKKNKKKKLKKNFELNKNYFLLTGISILFTLIWFIKFPIYRYGLSFIFLSITLIFIYLTYKLNLLINIKSSRKIFLIFFIVSVVGFAAKNINRIYYKHQDKYNNYPWPKIYTLEDSKENKPSPYEAVVDSDQNILYFHSGGQECMYSKSPCSNYRTKHLKRDETFGYLIYYKNNSN